MGTQNRSRGARRYTVEPDTDFLVRRAGVEDALQIADVHVAAWRETYGPLLPAGALDSLDAGERAQKWAGIIAGGEEVLVAEDAGGIVAWAPGGPGRDDDAPVDRELEGIYSPARVHGSGVGQLLLDAVIADSPAYLWVLDGNARAEAFYRRNGFRRDGAEREHAVAGIPRTTVRMVRS